MKQTEFEQRLLELSATTRIPFTVANLQVLTGETREKAKRHLDALSVDGVLEMDSDDAGNLVWSVPGADRRMGPTTVGEWLKLNELRGQVSSSSLVRGGAHALVGTGEKSVLASAALSFFLGPFGLLYAAPVVEAVAAIAAVVVVATVLPASLVGALMSLCAPVFGGLGALYAWQFQKTGRKTHLLFGRGDDVKRLGGRSR